MLLAMKPLFLRTSNIKQQSTIAMLLKHYSQVLKCCQAIYFYDCVLKTTGFLLTLG
jgi:hypothetical protein